jgi:hypothetical protein
VYHALTYIILSVSGPHRLLGIITINVHVVFMARYTMVLRGATSLQGALEGPTPSTAPSNDVASLKTIV